MNRSFGIPSVAKRKNNKLKKTVRTYIGKQSKTYILFCSLSLLYVLKSLRKNNRKYQFGLPSETKKILNFLLHVE